MATIERYRACVPAEAFLILYFDDIAARPRALLETVCEFLGVRADEAAFGPIGEPVHRGEPRELPPDLYDALKSALKPAYERLRSLDSPVVDAWFRRHYG
jgi:hypothetical protein